MVSIWAGPFDGAEGQAGDLLLSVPPSLLHIGSNRLYVLLFNPRNPGPEVSLSVGIAGQVGLSEIFIGEDMLVRAQYDRYTLFRTKMEEFHCVFRGGPVC
jgi:hypothetical protein